MSSIVLGGFYALSTDAAHLAMMDAHNVACTNRPWCKWLVLAAWPLMPDFDHKRNHILRVEVSGYSS